ncbi:hypothetical protein OF829_07685 [Sphingomonas sp. LB-2]|uniref:hypothetical protein n=1 Tax=Sphingomonas caeni TaxID=2984949 RepID=UPI00222E5DF0|nr:hypothetical protein [Sphingomonas caeni]MCW3847117.1 hypothetical protein [Sphingomonas caeni]
MVRHALLLAPLALAACAPEGNSTIILNGEDGNVSIVTDAEGHTTVAAPGVNASISLPKIDIDAADFDVNGVKLYPGSTVKDFKLDASEGFAAKGKGHLSIAFDAPASLDKVQAWFRDNMAKRNFKVSAQGNGFAGTTDEGDPVTLELTPDGPDKTKGRMTIGA